MTGQNRVCIYHRIDFDGLGSGAVVRRYFGDGIRMVGLNYGDELPDDLIINKAMTVVMVDFSLQPMSRMKELIDKCGLLVWIEHHSEAIRSAEESGLKIGRDFLGVHDTSQAACLHAWEYFFTGIPAPTPLVLLSQYDSWQWAKFKPEDQARVLEFQYGLRTREVAVEDNEFWRPFVDPECPGVQEFIDRFRAMGVPVIAYDRVQNKGYALSHAFMTELDGHSVCAMNMGGQGFARFAALTEHPVFGEAEVYLSFAWRDGQWSVGLYSETVDCGALAGNHGGGGHAGAAGFQCEELPFKLR